MNIILDMDQTLIDGIVDFSFVPFDSSIKIIPRPYLKEFLKFCFESFQYVSIWTAASEKWFESVNKEIFKPILEELNGELNNKYKFDFIFTSNQCTIVWTYSEWHGQSIMHKEKRIRRLHKSCSKYPQYTIDNTIIIDDTKITFKNNYGNGIHINPFETCYSGWKKDTELLNLTTYISNVLIPHYKQFKTVRNLEKRFWRSDNI